MSHLILRLLGRVIRVGLNLFNLRRVPSRMVRHQNQKLISIHCPRRPRPDVRAQIV